MGDDQVMIKLIARGIKKSPIKSGAAILSACLTLCLSFSIVPPGALATDKSELDKIKLDKIKLDKAVASAAGYIAGSVTRPGIGVISGEWAVIGLARAGRGADDAYFEGYYKAVEKAVINTKGKLHESKYTEHSRVILGLTAAGYDPRDVAAYDLTLALADFERTVAQGVNGPIWALIAMDSAGYKIPANPQAATRATREMYVGEILKRQLDDGGWNLTGAKSDPGITGMALQALAKYQDEGAVRASISKALAFLSDTQRDDGGFAATSDPDSESASQVLIGLCALGVDVNDSRFIKKGISILDNLLSYQNNNGSFNHAAQGGGGVSQMSSEQGLCALVAVARLQAGSDSLYRMSDAKKRSAPGVSVSEASAGGAGAMGADGNAATGPEAGEKAVTGKGGALANSAGLPGKHADIRKTEIMYPGKTFKDVAKTKIGLYVNALAERGIIGGRTADSFEPNATMTRSEYASIITRALGLPAKPSSVKFADVSPEAWYAGSVSAALYYNLVSGKSENSFDPQALISRQEAAAMATRAAKLAGADMAILTDNTAIRSALAQFDDYREVAEWARASVGFCVAEGILDDTELLLRPLEAVTRGEVAGMVFNMLSGVDLL